LSPGRFRWPRQAAVQDAALEERVELALDELRQIGACSVFGLRDECSAPGGTAWSVPGGDARTGLARHPAPTWAAGQWFAREAPEGVTSDGLNPCSASQSPTGVPTCGRQLQEVYFLVSTVRSPTARASSGEMPESCPSRTAGYGRPATAGSRNCPPRTGQLWCGLERQQSGVELVCPRMSACHPVSDLAAGRGASQKLTLS